jgi:myosin heavy subunit
MQAMFFTAMRLKSIAKRFMVKPEEKNRAAIKIQSIVRRYLTKAKSKRVEEKRKAKERRRAQKLKAATIIYSAVLRYMAITKERRAEEKRKAKAKRRAQKLNAIMRIQSVIRRFLVNTEEERAKAKHDAATQIQSIFRGYMATTSTKRAEEKRQAEEKWSEQKHLAIMKVKRTVRKYMFSVKFMHKLEEKKDHDIRVAQQNEIESIKARIFELSQQTKTEISEMRKTTECEKENLKEEQQRKVDSMSKEDVLDAFDAEMRILDEQDENKQELVNFEKQSEDLKSSIAEMEEMIAINNEENADLQKANAEIRGMFESLNAFARNKFEDKKKLVAAQQKYSKVLLPKVKSDISQGSKSGMAENKVKELYRSHMYKVLQGVQASDRYDQILYDDIMYMVRECETSLGAEVLDLNGSLNFMDALNAREEAIDSFQEETYGGHSNDSQNWNSFESSQFLDSSSSNFLGESKSWGQSVSHLESSTDAWGDSWGQSKSGSSNNASEDSSYGDQSRDFGKSMNFREESNSFDKSKKLSQFFGATQSFDDSDRFDESEQGSEKVWDGNAGGNINFSNAGVNWDALSAWTES